MISPTGVHVVEVHPTFARIAWSPVPRASVYQVVDETGRVIHSGPQTEVVVTGLAPSRRYRFGVSACSPFEGCSYPSYVEVRT